MARGPESGRCISPVPVDDTFDVWKMSNGSLCSCIRRTSSGSGRRTIPPTAWTRMGGNGRWSASGCLCGGGEGGADAMKSRGNVHISCMDSL